MSPYDDLRGRSGEEDSVEQEIVCTLAFSAACVFAGAFSLVAYALGIACFIVAGMRLARDPT